MNHPSEPVLVLDMSTLRFRRGTGRAPTRISTRNGCLLSVVHPRQDESDRDLAFRCFDAALKSARVRAAVPGGDPRSMRVALYNPLSGDVSLGGTPDTVTFTGVGTVELDPDGTVALLEDGTLTIGSVQMDATQRSVRELSRVLATQSV